MKNANEMEILNENAAPDLEKVHEMAGLVLNEVGAAANAALVRAGYDLGLFDALATKGPITAGELAAAIGGSERHLREWLSSQYASGFIEYDSASESFSMTPEQQMVFVNPDSPAYLGGAWDGVASIYLGLDAITDSLRTGKGVAWGSQCSCLFCGTAEFFRPSYQTSLVSDWIPSLEGVADKLQSGGKVLDVGCGFGHSTSIMSGAFPNSDFLGIDLHEDSIKEARKIASETGLGKARFEAAPASSFTGERFDLVTVFDALHDMGNPEKITRHIREDLLADGGTLMLVEPKAADTIEGNRNPLGRAFYAFSTAFCTPSALTQLSENQSADSNNVLGAQAGQARLTEVLNEAGFSKVRRASENDSLMVLEARG